MKSSKSLLGVLAGAAAGATLGILFAPDKGSNTRKNISQKGEDILDSLKSKFENISLSNLNDGESVKSKAENLFNNGKEKAREAKDEIKHEAEDLLYKGKEKAEEAKNEMNNATK